MTRDDDFIGQLEGYLDEYEGMTPLPEPIRDAVRAQLPTTKQLGLLGGPLERFPVMNNNFIRFGVAAAAVVVVAFLLIRFLPGGNVGGEPEPTPTPVPTASPSPMPAANVYPDEGPLALGRHPLTVQGVPLSFSVPTTGWSIDENGYVSKDTEVAADQAEFIFWSLANIYSDSCAHTPLSPPVGPSTADLADAVWTAFGTEATEPSDVTVGGRAAKHVVLTVPEDIDCDRTSFYLWYDACGGALPEAEGCYRYATELGDTIRLWILDVGGARLVIEADARKGASAEVEQEIQQIVDSIQFE
jgi:hypothetical protein